LESSLEEKEHLIEKITEFNEKQVPFLQTERFIDVPYSLKIAENLFIGGIRAFLYC